MEIHKILNNNVVLTENDMQQELVVMGRGLAFQKKIGDTIADADIEKTFVLRNSEVSLQLAELLSDVPESYLYLSEKIIREAKERIREPLDDYLYVALTDHLSFAISRHKQKLPLKNPLLWEVRKFYKEEYQVGLRALEIIREETGYELEEDEAASIAMHLLNSQVSGEGFDSMVQVTKIVNNLLSIVKYHYNMELDESSINYERFLTHLRYFAFRLIRNEEGTDNPTDNFLYEQVSKKYDKAFTCSRKIANYVESSLNKHVSKDEQVYLTLHIERVSNREHWNHS